MELNVLKTLIEMVAGLPLLSVWVLAGFLAYKLAIVGSIYGVLHKLIERTFELLRNRELTLSTITSSQTEREQLELSLRQFARAYGGVIGPGANADLTKWLKELKDRQKL